MKNKLDDTSQDNTKTDEEKNELTEFSANPELNPRAEAMKNLVDRSDEDRETENQEFMDDNNLNPMDAEEELEEIEELGTEETVDKPDELEDTEIIEREGKKFLKLKVDGNDLEMPVDAAVSRLQQDENANHRIWEADQIKQKYEALIAQHQEETTREDVSSEDAADTQERLNDVLTKVYDGEVAEAAEELSAIIASSKAPRPVEVNIDEKVDARLAARDNYNSLKSAYNAFMADEDFKAVTNDQVLLDRVNTFTEDLQKDSEYMSTNPSYEEMFAKAGNKVKDWLSTVSGTSLGKPSEEVNSRLERKRSTPSKPTARTVRRGVPEEKSPYATSTSDVIRSMAEKRGQTNL